MIPWKFGILNPKGSLGTVFTRKVCELFVYKYTETIEYVKN